VVDATAPTATITAIAPDPRGTPVESITVVFSEPVTGLDVSDLSLTRDGSANLLTAANTVGSTDGGITWTIGGLSGLTGAQGTYVITLANSGTGIADALGNPMVVGATESWQVAAAPAPVITEVYVRGSTWAGVDADPANVTFKEYLKAEGLGDDVYGFRVDGLPGGTTLPWINANQIVLRYSLPLTSQGVPSPASITLDGQLSDYAVNAAEQLDGQTVVLTLDRPLGAQPAASADPTMGDRIRLSVPNAGPAGATYALDLNALQGDADRAANARVTAIDLGFVKARLNRTAGEAPAAGAIYTAFADVNGDGRINAVDLGAVKARVNDFLPAPLAPAGAAITADSMTKDLFGTMPIL